MSSTYLALAITFISILVLFIISFNIGKKIVLIPRRNSGIQENRLSESLL
jgi:hypothetical protein